MKIRDRIQELRRVPASELRPNPRNWRTHPKEQADAMRGLLSEIGYADALLARPLEDGSLELIDGHLRAETTPDAMVPVLILDVSAEEADKILLSHDPVSAMAGVDRKRLDDLLASVETDSPAVEKMLDDLVKQANASDLFNDPIQDSPDIALEPSFQVVVECTDETDQRDVYETMTEQGYACRLMTI